MNESARVLPLLELMGRPECWGRSEGREVHQRLLEFVERNAGTVVFRISMKGVKRMDISFASETIVEVARRYRRTKGFCVVDLSDTDLIENLDAAAEKKEQPIVIWGEKTSMVVGRQPSEGLREAFQFAMSRIRCRAAEFASKKEMSIANASMKFKQLWEQGFLLRSESTADTGGVEFIYHCIG
jgi:hypothetical protein